MGGAISRSTLALAGELAGEAEAEAEVRRRWPLGPRGALRSLGARGTAAPSVSTRCMVPPVLTAGAEQLLCAPVVRAAFQLKPRKKGKRFPRDSQRCAAEISAGVGELRGMGDGLLLFFLLLLLF